VISPSLRVASDEAADADTLYGALSRADRYIHATRDRALFGRLRRAGYATLSGRRILELGCGAGSLLRTLVHYGADRRRLEGIDVDAAQLWTGRDVAPGVGLARATAASLPFHADAFDLVFASTVFSSMLEQPVRLSAAGEAMRVLRPGGIMVVYDFWTNPLNSAVRAIGEREMRGLFPSHVVEVERVTLAPPIVRALGGRDALCEPLDRIRPLRTHLLATVLKT
jgi:ubiquinone/menaquinone biosynthesis C-methylase UbiE